MKVFVVLVYDWDTEGGSNTTIAGVFSSLEKVPDRYQKIRSDYSVEEVELDEVGSW